MLHWLKRKKQPSTTLSSRRETIMPLLDEIASMAKDIPDHRNLREDLQEITASELKIKERLDAINRLGRLTARNMIDIELSEIEIEPQLQRFEILKKVSEAQASSIPAIISVFKDLDKRKRQRKDFEEAEEIPACEP
jgi:hypothetical protein